MAAQQSYHLIQDVEAIVHPDMYISAWPGQRRAAQCNLLRRLALLFVSALITYVLLRLMGPAQASSVHARVPLPAGPALLTLEANGSSPNLLLASHSGDGANDDDSDSEWSMPTLHGGAGDEDSSTRSGVYF